MSKTATTVDFPALIPRPRSLPWTAWLVPKPFDIVSSLLYLGTLFLFYYERMIGLYAHSWHWDQALVVTLAIAALLGIDRVEYRQYGLHTPPRVAAALLVARVLLIEVVAQLDDFSFSPFLYLLIPFTASVYFGPRVSYGVAALIWLAYATKISMYSVRWYTLQADIHSVLIFSIGLVFAITMAQVVARERVSRARAELLLAELAQSHARLQAYAAQIEDLAATKERNHLAREIHDSLGHYLTVINVQLEKALAVRGTRPTEADQAVTQAKRLAREALHDVRRSVGALRTTTGHATPIALVPALRELADNMAGDQLAVDLHIEGSEDAYSTAARLALYRAAQEGLTNISKHAAASTAHLEVVFGGTEARLTLRDNGQGFGPDPATDGETAGGYGLPGLEERVALVGGDVTVTSRPGAGTCLMVRVPRTPEPAEPAPPVAGAR